MADRERFIKVPNRSELAQMSAITEGKDIQRYPLYSFLDMPASTGVTQMNFFANAQGSSVTLGGLSYTMDRERTNIQKANALATPNDFILKSLRLFVFPAYAEITSTIVSIESAIDMEKLLIAGGYLRVVMGTKETLVVAPLLAISSGSGLTGSISTNTDTEEIVYLTNGHPLIFKVDPWILIPSELNFNVELNWTASPSLSYKAKVGIWLDGDIIRPVQ